MGEGESFEGGQYLETVEAALYKKFLDKLSADEWDDCRQVVKLMEGLSII